MAEQRTNDQISPKDGEEYTPEVLGKMSLEELEKVQKEMKLRLDQRGSSRPVTHANNWLDNKKNERDYLDIIRDLIADKLEESNSIIKSFEDFSKVNEETSYDEVNNVIDDFNYITDKLGASHSEDEFKRIQKSIKSVGRFLLDMLGKSPSI